MRIFKFDVGSFPEVNGSVEILSYISEEDRKLLLESYNLGKKVKACLRVGRKKRLKKVWIEPNWNGCNWPISWTARRGAA